MRRQAGGAGGGGHLRDLFSMQSICWWPGANPGFVALILSAWHIGMHKQVGGAVDSSPEGSF